MGMRSKPEATKAETKAETKTSNTEKQDTKMSTEENHEVEPADKVTTAETPEVEVLDNDTAGADAADAAKPVGDKKEVVVQKSAPAPALKKAGGKFAMILSEFEDALSEVEWGVLDTIKVNNGKIFDDAEHVYGTCIEFQLISQREYLQINNGGKKKDKNLIIRSSYDGIHLSNVFTYKTDEVDDDGEDVVESISTVADLEAYFIEKGFKRKMKRDTRMELVVEILDAEKDNDNIGMVCCIDLSKMSVKEFDRYKFQNSLKVRAGRLTNEQVSHMVAEVKEKSGGDFEYNVFAFTPFCVWDEK